MTLPTPCRHPLCRRPAGRARWPVAGALWVLALTAPAQTDAAEIYRTVDEHGNVVFTDVPPRPGEPGEAVELEAPNSYRTPPQRDTGISLEAWLESQEEPEPDEAAPVGYERLQVAQPPHDAAIRDNAGNVVIRADLQPELRPGHAVQVYIDGTLRETARDTTIQLVNLDRGTHSVELRVVDEAGTPVITSEPSVFHLHRRSVILQPPRPLPRASGG